MAQPPPPAHRDQSLRLVKDGGSAAVRSAEQNLEADKPQVCLLYNGGPIGLDRIGRLAYAVTAI